MSLTFALVTTTCDKLRCRNKVLKFLADSTWGANKETFLTTYNAIGRYVVSNVVPVWSANTFTANAATTNAMMGAFNCSQPPKFDNFDISKCCRLPNINLGAAVEKCHKYVKALKSHNPNYPVYAHVNDLKRFGLADVEAHYDDDIDANWMPDSCGGDVYSDNPYPYMDFMGNEEDMSYDASQIDPRLLKEIIRQMKEDPRFEHLWKHLDDADTNGLMAIDHKMEEKGGYYDDESLHVDLDDNFQGDDNYEIE
ncbi:uncharacterized protein [Musca autumnalis]|uniref:uncharacterized protein n=1 Tax=Musca autumnalis TaxID=221902 RepID=UPI003CEAD04B